MPREDLHDSGPATAACSYRLGAGVRGRNRHAVDCRNGGPRPDRAAVSSGGRRVPDRRLSGGAISRAIAPELQVIIRGAARAVRTLVVLGSPRGGRAAGAGG